MAEKTYVLLPHTEGSAEVYHRVNANQRARLYKRPVDHAYSKYTFVDRDGKQRTNRLKLGCPTLDQAVQIKEYNIPANDGFTTAERDILRFEYMVLVTDDELVQKHLEESPQFVDFWVKKDKNGKDDPKNGKACSTREQIKPLYKIHDRMKEINEDDRIFNIRVDCAVKIKKLTDVDEAKALLIRLNGAFFKAPDTIEECKGLLRDYLDDATEEMMEGLLKEDKDVTIDEKVTVLIGSAIALDILSFDKRMNQVTMQRDGKTVSVKEISSSYTAEERKRYFAEFLTSADGKLLYNDIAEAVLKAQKPQEEDGEKEEEEEDKIE